jgi:hypothetical protein
VRLHTRLLLLIERCLETQGRGIPEQLIAKRFRVSASAVSGFRLILGKGPRYLSRYSDDDGGCVVEEWGIRFSLLLNHEAFSWITNECYNIWRGFTLNWALVTRQRCVTRLQVRELNCNYVADFRQGMGLQSQSWADGYQRKGPTCKRIFRETLQGRKQRKMTRFGTSNVGILHGWGSLWSVFFRKNWKE